MRLVIFIRLYYGPVLPLQFNMILGIQYKPIIKTLALVGMGCFLVNNIRAVLKARKEIEKAKQAKIYAMKQIQSELTKQSSEVYLVKATPLYCKPINFQKQIRYFEKKYSQPSDLNIIEKSKLFFQEESILSRMLTGKKQPVFWSAQSEVKSKPIEIKGFGKILNDVFVIEKTFEHKKDLGYYTKFFTWIYEKVTKVFHEDFQMQKLMAITKKPLFFGPIVGFLKYEVSLAKDTQLLLMCNIEEGRLVPKLTALTKSQILNYLSKSLLSKYLLTLASVLGTLIAGRLLLKDIKRWVNLFKMKGAKTYFNPKQYAEDDKICIICYLNCKNLIFFDCRHMIMCQQCLQNYDSEVCPYCKIQIDEIKIVENCQI